jgi:hypothetical protein
MMRSVEKGAVKHFLQEHRFSDINHCRRVSRWPLSRQCCPLSLAAERGDVLNVILLLQQGADPLLPGMLSRQREACTACHQDGRWLLEWAAGESGRRLAAESGAFWSIFHVVDAVGHKWEEPLFRNVQRSDPLLRQPEQAA